MKTPVVNKKNENKAQILKNSKDEIKKKEVIVTEASQEEIFADDDFEIFHGFDIKDIPKPIIIKVKIKSSKKINNLLSSYGLFSS